VISWAILTGEYPPKVGGVADYTRNVALGLARAGDTVHVITAPSPSGEAPVADPSIEVHVLPDRWGPRSLVAASRVLARVRPTHVLVEYVAQAWGMRGANVPFALWVAARPERVFAMFHEVAWPFRRSDPPKHQALAAVTHAMAAIVATKAARTFVSIPEWNAWIRRAQPFAREAEWLPIPSGVSTTVDPAKLAEVRRRLGIRSGDPVVGYFGMIGYTVAAYLEPALERIAADPSRTLLLLGPTGAPLAERLRAKVGGAGARVVATGRLDAGDVAAHLAACALVVLPYVDGVSTRRSSVMAALALGVPVVSNDGELTAPIWREGAVALAVDPSPGAIAAEVEALLADPARRTAMGERGRALYEERFSMERTIEGLRAAAGETGAAARW
jgi:glycosyltransferase involved in cell wall biosynthesis